MAQADIFMGTLHQTGNICYRITAVIASVNYALAHPNEAPEQVARQEPILEPIY